MGNRILEYFMTKTINRITVPEEWESTNEWDSHRPLLYLAINEVPHETFHEYGMGDGSTPLLRKWYNKINTLGKEYYSYESNKDWAEKYLTDEYKKSPYRDNVFVLKNHAIAIIDDYVKWNILDEAILFVDSAPGEQRKEIIAKHASKALVILVHDSEDDANYVYGMANILSTFKYKLDYKPEKFNAHTTAVSNFINITKWAE